jgi:ribose transport system ATP-binding protein
MNAPFLIMTGISKQYRGISVLDGVSLSVRRGQVIGLVGENGAGKSTLMKILGGVVAPSAGALALDGARVERLTVGQSMAAGIAFVHQELNLFDNLTAAANIFIGREPLNGGWLRLVDSKTLSRTARLLLDQVGGDFDADTPVAALSLAQRQLVEIAKALSLNARLVIMDEPSSSLMAKETERLLAVVAKLKAEGVAVIYISHRLGEVERCADRVVVLRDGRRVAALEGGEIEAGTMIRHMIGRELKTLYRPPMAEPGETVLETLELRTAYRPDQPVSLAIRRGEILGLAGLAGSGRTALASTIFGLASARGGEIRIAGRRAAIKDAGDAIGQGIFLVPEDRKRSGLVLGFSLTKNMTLANLAAHARAGIVDRKSEQTEASRQCRRLDIRCRSTAVEAGSLSGGNQQKVALGKWLGMTPRLLIFDEPTRGIDVGAKNEVYGIMRALADDGAGILMISSDMEEVIGVSDRVAVMHEGRITGLLERRDLSEQRILSLAVGRSNDCSQTGQTSNES